MGRTGRMGRTVRKAARLRARSRLHGERGVALVIAMAALLLMSAVTAGLVFIASSDGAVASNYRNSVEAVYAADGVAERVLAELAASSDWDALLGGFVSSSFVDGPPAGVRTLRDGGTVDLTQVLSVANCEAENICSGADLPGNPAADQSGSADQPGWRLFAHGPLDAVMPTIDSPFYVLVLLAPGPSEGDAGASTGSPGEEPPREPVISLRAEAFGLRDTHRAIELTVVRSAAFEDGQDEHHGPGGYDGQDAPDGQDGRQVRQRRVIGPVRVLSWREIY
jgi:hypothetical protein